jgi:hypothetical protein
MPTERWREDLERTERDLEKICRRHPGWPNCNCHLCEVLSLLSDCAWHLRRHQKPGSPSGLDLVAESIDVDD